jgi:Glycosyl transferase family 2
MRGRLKRALDWRLRAVTSRLDAVHSQIRQVEERLDSLAAVLRAIVGEEAENRRRLFALRADEAYEAAYADASPLVSITLATRDRPELLITRALPSILAQTHTNLEVLIVGDAAPPEVAEALAAIGDRRVTYTNLSQRIAAHADPDRHWLVGSTMARNEAARRAQGRWLLHFDDDDHLRPEAIASLLALARDQRAEVAYGGFEQHHPDGGLERRLAFPPRLGSFGWQGALVHGGLHFFERELVAADLDLPGDAYLLERMLRAGVRFAMLDGIVWDYFPSTLWKSSSASQITSQISSTVAGSSAE